MNNTDGNAIEKGTLYVVATPIGNMMDISDRAKKVLGEVDFIAAEDTRISGKLLMLLDIKKPFVRYYEHNKEAMHEPIIEKLKSGQAGAIITDAGTPAISDPGEFLVKRCLDENIKVIPVPGVSAAIAALSVSGMPSRSFVFEGFLSDRNSERKKQLEMLAGEKRTAILYCAPHDIVKRLGELYDALGDRELFIARELTKLNEETIKTTLSKAVENPPVARGEFVLILGGKKDDAEGEFWSSMTIPDHVAYYEKITENTMEACKLCAKDRGLSKSSVYSEIIKSKSNP